MKAIIGVLFVAAAFVVASGGVLANGLSTGEREYASNCVVCHGVDGKAGPYVEFLKVTPSDLTMLSKNNGGVFPFERIYQVIDGRAAVKAHGPRDMPVWGVEYNEAAEAYYSDYFKAYDSEAFIRSRVFALIEYLISIQK